MSAMKVFTLALLAIVLPTLALAQTPAVPAKTPHGFRAEFIANLDEVQEKIVSLAEAVPAEAYGWRPAAGVRSISEVYMHIAGGNYFLATFIGVAAPKMNGDLEKTVTKKADVIVELKKSFDHLRAAAAQVKDLETSVKMFGNQTTYRGVLMAILSHLHEHLGQSIAYARMNGVVPPWSR